MDQKEATLDIDMDAPIAVALKRGRKKKRTDGEEQTKETAVEDKRRNKKKKRADGQEQAKETAVEDRADANEGDPSPRTTISLFDFSVENHFKAVDTISKLCGEPEPPYFDPAEIDRLTSSITFLREWNHFRYLSRTIRFACHNENNEGIDVIDQISLPQFSSAIVPKKQKGTMGDTSSDSCKDYVMYVGGSVWALDWCPRVNISSESHIRAEYVAVAAHPPESSYHKIGAPLTGRGVVQIWCLLNGNSKKDESSHIQKIQKKGARKPETAMIETDTARKPRGRPRKYPVNESANKIDSNIQPKPRGRPRKHPVVESANTKDSISEDVEPPAVECAEDSSTSLSMDVANPNTTGHVSEKDSGLGREASDDKSTSSKLKRSKVNITKKVQASESAQPLLMQDENGKFSSVNSQTPISSDPDSMMSEDNVINLCDTRFNRHSVPKDVWLPRMVLCLAHNGKVAWDLKWRPSNVTDKQRMGYLAVLLGNGALEVWEVPFPQTAKVIYLHGQKEGNDPRFVKLEPVFRCSALKCGDRQSIPLTLEWSPSSPHDMILAGCHDGVVALWKFSCTGSSVDTRPLLCFSADTVPIRALSWAPIESYSESSNVIATAGHKSLKFWDIRDPFHPLWDFPLQKIIYSLDWLADPSCVVASVDDGSIRLLSVMTSNDMPVTGTPFVGTAVKGFHSYACSSFPIWSIQASRLPGFIAYCTADGTTLQFQLTAKAVYKDPSRHRAPHFLCGSLKEEESTLTVLTPLPNTPFAMRRSSNEWGDTPRSIRGLTTKINQENRAREKAVQDQTSSELPASSHDDEQGMVLGSNDTMPTEKLKKASSKSKSKADELAVGGADDNPVSAQEEVGEFPPKSVAMHRVRWNKNQGSENWLCYGGAAGILRCQEINTCKL